MTTADDAPGDAMPASYSAGAETITDDERRRLDAERDRIRATYQRPRDHRPPSSARGVHHVALISADVERTTRFYQELLGFPLTTMFENRDLAGSTHFFFDIGNGNTIAFFDLPGVDPGPYAEVLGGLHHLAISIEVAHWEAAKSRLDDAGIPYDHVDETSLYFRGPDGERLELIADPLRWMYGERVD
jgi:catechol 2,3-dioxygenase-like lactoylglutathione lyase family enzyme